MRLDRCAECGHTRECHQDGDGSLRLGFRASVPCRKPGCACEAFVHASTVVKADVRRIVPPRKLVGVAGGHEH